MIFPEAQTMSKSRLLCQEPMVISNRFQVLSREKSLFRTLLIPSLCQKPVAASKNMVFFSKVVPQLSNKNSIPVARRFPDIDKLSRLISSWTATSIQEGYFSFPGNISLIFIRSPWSRESQETGMIRLAHDCSGAIETLLTNIPVPKQIPGLIVYPLWA